MKKTTAGLTLTAVTGFGLLTVSPAFAAEPAGPSVSIPAYATCAEARAAGRTNIPFGDPEFTPGLDGDGDGIGCDDPSRPMPQPQGHMDSNGTWTPTQVDQMPAQVGRMPNGGANTGIAQEPEGSNAGALALGGGLVLVAAAGGTFVIRRRLAGQE
ncbi:excalibur calcium-binding domain-containing protein [Arthrobacter yangruifuii]|uniref:excalibur calcium-binding domain-containing protein n=1 Tax=Arthrobacter yangruifuii TaxID=2606616 RepID=UPI001FE9EEA1|nr:excalibur calcium-binding domain-containing protein [Arthrobacter yangruifuii]